MRWLSEAMDASSLFLGLIGFYLIGWLAWAGIAHYLKPEFSNNSILVWVMPIVLIAWFFEMLRYYEKFTGTTRQTSYAWDFLMCLAYWVIIFMPPLLGYFDLPFSWRIKPYYLVAAVSPVSIFAQYNKYRAHLAGRNLYEKLKA